MPACNCQCGHAIHSWLKQVSLASGRFIHVGSFVGCPSTARKVVRCENQVGRICKCRHTPLMVRAYHSPTSNCHIPFVWCNTHDRYLDAMLIAYSRILGLWCMLRMANGTAVHLIHTGPYLKIEEASVPFSNLLFSLDVPQSWVETLQLSQ